MGEAAVADYVLDVPRRGNEWINANQRLHWTTRSELVSSWRTIAGWTAKAAKLPALGPSRVVAELVMSARRTARLDPANYAPTAKAVIDGLVDAGIWPDDSHGWVTGPDMRLADERVAPGDEVLRLHIYGVPCCDGAEHHHQEAHA